MNKLFVFTSFLVAYMVLRGLHAQTNIPSMPLHRDIAYQIHRGLVEEAAERKRVRYSLLRKGYADAMSSVIRRDCWWASLSFLRTLLLKEFHLPHDPLGYRSHPSMPLVKFPPDQDVYSDPWQSIID
jgi:hypothetical protein